MPDTVVDLRACTSADAPVLALIGAATVLEAFAGLVPGDSLVAHCLKNHVPAAYERAFEEPQTRAWLAEVAPGAAPVGYALLTTPDFPSGLAESGDMELRRIYIFSRFHSGGTGQRLMDLVIASARHQQAKRLLLGVHPGNQRAIAFYRKNKFVQIGVRSFQVGTSVFEDPVLCREL